MSEEPQQSSRTGLPTEVDSEDPMLMLGELKFSLRQMLTLAFAAAIWFGFFQITAWILPISDTFAGLLWSWIIIGGVFLALKKKDGRPYEEYLSDKINFLISEREYIMKDKKAGETSVAWDDLDDDDDFDIPSSWGGSR